MLLIVAALAAEELASLHGSAHELGLDVLVEVHDGEELQCALGLGADLIGINNRDLRDFSVEVGRTSRLMEQVPVGVTVVSESGIATAEQLRDLAADRGARSAGRRVADALPIPRRRCGAPESSCWRPPTSIAST